MNTLKFRKSRRTALSPERQEMVVRYLPLARKLARPLKDKWPGLCDEFESAAALALVEAAESFDPQRNVNFATFARHRIRGALLDTQREAFEHTQRFLTNTPATGSLLMGHGTETGNGRILGVEPSRPIGDELERNEAVEDCLSKLPKKHQAACRQTYFHGRTQVEIAKMLGYSQSRLSTIHKEALEYLRDIWQAEGYDGQAA